MGELGAIFNPGMRHEIAERKAKANRREEEGNADDGDMRIDLLSGVAVIALGEKRSSRGPQDARSGSEDESSVTSIDNDDDTAAAASTADGEASGNERSDPQGADQAAPRDETPRADAGDAPPSTEHVDVDSGDEVDQAALDIVQETSNSEPPA